MNTQQIIDSVMNSDSDMSEINDSDSSVFYRITLKAILILHQDLLVEEIVIMMMKMVFIFQALHGCLFVDKSVEDEETTYGRLLTGNRLFLLLVGCKGPQPKLQ